MELGIFEMNGRVIAEVISENIALRTAAAPKAY